jgi:hypothetical protein
MKRFFVDGQPLKQVDDDALEALKAHAIGQGGLVDKNRTEAGWTTGDHILDIEFDYAKNAVGECLYAAMRIDTNKPPADLVRAYQRINEQGALEASGQETLTKDQRRDAKDQAQSQADREAAAGQFKSMKHIPVLWDLDRNEVYLGTTSPTAVEWFLTLFEQTFDRTLIRVGAGAMASRYVAKTGMNGVLTEIRPAHFIDPPDGAQSRYDTTPTDDPRRNDFLGTEWLTWLWHRAQTESAEFAAPGADPVTFMFDKAMDLACAYELTGSDTIRFDDPSRAPEARVALQIGKLPLKAGIRLMRHGEMYALSIRADQMNISSLRLPVIEDADPRTIFLERVEQIRHATQSLDDLFAVFLRKRLSSDWSNHLNATRGWIAAGKNGNGQPGESGSARHAGTPTVQPPVEGNGADLIADGGVEQRSAAIVA